MPRIIDKVIGRLQEYWPQPDTAAILRAYDFARKAHEGQLRRSGEPYIFHPLAVAEILTSVEADPTSIIGGLLHDVVEDNDSLELEQIQEQFGEEVAVIVGGVTKLKRLDLASQRERQASNLRKMLLAMARDLRVVIIKLADRLHNMRTLWALDPEHRRRTSEETLYLLAPLAHRLGVQKLKAELEDLALRYLEPRAYWDIVRRLGASRAEMEAYIEGTRRLLRRRLLAAGIPAEVHGRAKHVYSIWNKMQTEGLTFEQVQDIHGLRVIVHTVEQCYQALGVVHDQWHPIPGEFTDYIAVPKSNRYQSLHTKVLGPGGHPLEVQIRTWEMHRVAEYGVAAHWRYKEGKEDPRFDEEIQWLRSLLELGSDLAEQHEYLELIQSELLRDQVFVFTPKGEVIDLPAGSTPLDFAYRVHTEIGHHCAGARVNGRLVALDYRLRTGDVVEIITSPQAHPTRDWLEIVQSSHAKAKVRRWLRARVREESYEAGRDAVRQAAARLPAGEREQLDWDRLTEVAHQFGYPDEETLLAAVGYGDIEPDTVVRRLLEKAPPRPTTLAEEVQLKLPSFEEAKETSAQGPPVVSLADGFHGRLARCCNPVPGDPILGYVTRGSGIAVHRADCNNILYRARREPERVMTLRWSDEAREQAFRVWVEVVAVDRRGLLSHIAAIVSDAGINIHAAEGKAEEPGLAKLWLEVEVSHRAQLTYLLDRLQAVADVVSAREVPAHVRPAV